jgi:hypothetical protein
MRSVACDHRRDAGSPDHDYLKKADSCSPNESSKRKILLNKRTGHLLAMHGLFATTLAITSSASYSNPRTPKLGLPDGHSWTDLAVCPASRAI